MTNNFRSDPCRQEKVFILKMVRCIGSLFLSLLSGRIKWCQTRVSPEHVFLVIFSNPCLGPGIHWQCSWLPKTLPLSHVTLLHLHGFLPTFAPFCYLFTSTLVRDPYCFTQTWWFFHSIVFEYSSTRKAQYFVFKHWLPMHPIKISNDLSSNLSARNEACQTHYLQSLIHYLL